MFCDHGRKAYKCTLCRREELNPPDILKVALTAGPDGIYSANIDVADAAKSMTDTMNELAQVDGCPIPVLALPKRFHDMELTYWQRYEGTRGPSVRMHFKCNRKHEYVCCRSLAFLRDWREGQIKQSQTFRTTSVESNLKEVPRTSVGTHAMKKVNDSKALLALMSDAAEREIGLTEAKTFIGSLLGPRTLMGAPVRAPREEGYIFPSDDGDMFFSKQRIYKHVQDTVFGKPAPKIQISIPDIDYAQIEQRVADSLGITIDNAGPEEVCRQIYGMQVHDSLVLTIPGGATAHIKDNCTLIINGKKLRVRREGDTFMMINEEFKKIC